MREDFAIRMGVALLTATVLFHAVPAGAIEFVSPLGTVDNIGGVQNGLCGKQGAVSQFALTMPSSFRYGTDDSDGRDFFDFYLLDGADRIIDGGHGHLTKDKPTVDMNVLNVQTEVVPERGPFRFVIVDTAHPGQTQTEGESFILSADASVTVDLNALNPACPAVATSGTTTRRPHTVARHVNAATAVRTVGNIQDHLARIAAPGAAARGGAATPPPPPIHRSTIHVSGAYARLRPEVVKRQRDRTMGIDTQRNALKTLLPYVSSDSAMRSGFFSGDRHYEIRTESGDIKTLPKENPKLAKRARLSVWLSGSVAPLQKTAGSGEEPGFDGDTIAVSAGADAWLTDRILTGMAVSYGDTYVTMPSRSAARDETSYGVSPYILFRPKDWLDLSAVVGMSTYDIREISKTGAAERIDRSDAASAFIALNAKATTGLCTIDGLQLSGATGFVRSIRRDSPPDGHASAVWSDFAQLTGNGELAFAIPIGDGLGLEPYVTGDLQAELLDRIGNNGLFGEFGGGLRLTDDESRLRASLEGFSIVGFNESAERRLNGTLSLDLDTDLLGGGLISPALSVASTMQTVRTDLGFRFRNDGQALTMGLTTFVSGDYDVYQGDITGITEREKGFRVTGHLSF